MSRFKLPERLKTIRGDKPLAMVANAIGITSQSLGRYKNGSRNPDSEVLFMIAEYYGVSCDYLLGLADDPSNDPETQTAMEVTGLSSKALEAIRRLHDNDIYRKLQRDRVYNSEILEKILLDDEFAHLLMRIGDLIKHRNELPDMFYDLVSNSPDAKGLTLRIDKEKLLEYELQFGMEEFKDIILRIVEGEENHGKHINTKK